MSHKIVVEPAPIRDSLYYGEEPKTFNYTWQQFFDSISRFSSGIKVYDETLDVGSVSANTTDEQTFTVTGIQANDIILSVNKPSHSTGLGVVNYRVPAANQIAITFMNTTAGAINPSGEEYRIVVLRG